MTKQDPYAAPSRIYPTAPKEQAPVEETSDSTVVPTGTITELTAWVGDDLGRAEAALEAEKAKDKPRVTLVEYLEDKVSGE